GVLVSLLVLQRLLELPLAVLRIFGLEERFGFNRMTPALFLADLGRGL
ncbi:MAG: M48 family peptidase, partial [Gammaproteobacteria bacterium]